VTTLISRSVLRPKTIMVLESTSLITAQGKLFNVTSVCVLCREFQQTGSMKRPCQISLQHHMTLSYIDYLTSNIMQDQLCEYFSVKQTIWWPSSSG